MAWQLFALRTAVHFLRGHGETGEKRKRRDRPSTSWTFGLISSSMGLSMPFGDFFFDFLSFDLPLPEDGLEEDEA